MPEPRTDAKRIVVVGAALVVLIVLVRTAWVSDDAYITFRTVDNFLHGFGLRWNVDSRVESFTHPLWLFAMIGATAVTGEVYYTSIFLSIGLTLLAVVLLLWRFTSSVALAFLAASVILLSKAFVDYSTSGLENPLTHLLLVLFFIVAASSGPRYLFWLSLLASLVMLNRVDAGLLVLPVLVLAVWKNGVRRSLVPVGLGVVPFVAWEVFSLIYYGFPAPNTAYAKLDTGVERGELVYQGFLYVLDEVGNDPLTLLTIMGALVLPFLLRRNAAISAGVALYVAYVVSIGGDFMSGRMFAEPFLCSVIDLTVIPIEEVGAPLAAGLGLIWTFGLSTPHPSILSNGSFGSDTTPTQLLRPNGIQEERRYYYPATGLLTAHRGEHMPNHRWLHLGEAVGASGARVWRPDAAGFFGYAAGPSVHIIDSWALGDPLLARLPADAAWRIGHFRRRVPEGYVQTVQTGRNVIRDPDVAMYYEKIRIITQDPIWSWTRLRTILEMNLGRYEDHVKSYGLIRVTADEVSHPVAASTPIDEAFDMTPRGIEITFSPPARADALEVSLSRNDTYRILWMSNGNTVGEQTIQQPFTSDGRFLTRIVQVPTRDLFDAICVVPSGGDALYSLGYLRIRN
jgi:arabinofuranosyltransferase